jgi:hypothetical protein
VTAAKSATEKSFEVNTRIVVIRSKLRASRQPVKIEAVPSGIPEVGGKAGNNRGMAILLSGMIARVASAKMKALRNRTIKTVAGQRR